VPSAALPWQFSGFIQKWRLFLCSFEPAHLLVKAHVNAPSSWPTSSLSNEFGGKGGTIQASNAHAPRVQSSPQ
jgi:hypothetical protein